MLLRIRRRPCDAQDRYLNTSSTLESIREKKKKGELPYFMNARLNLINFGFLYVYRDKKIYFVSEHLILKDKQYLRKIRWEKRIQYMLLHTFMDGWLLNIIHSTYLCCEQTKMWWKHIDLDKLCLLSIDNPLEKYEHLSLN